VTPADLDIPDIPKDLICPVSALVRSALYLDSFAASLASGSTFGELIAADDGTTLELATDVVQRWARQLEIDR
jgi:hypothetical protein